jgi:hypothetical protein
MTLSYEVTKLACKGNWNFTMTQGTAIFLLSLQQSRAKEDTEAGPDKPDGDPGWLDFGSSDFPCHLSLRNHTVAQCKCPWLTVKCYYPENILITSSRLVPVFVSTKLPSAGKPMLVSSLLCLSPEKQPKQMPLSPASTLQDHSQGDIVACSCWLLRDSNCTLKESSAVYIKLTKGKSASAPGKPKTPKLRTTGRGFVTVTNTKKVSGPGGVS